MWEEKEGLSQEPDHAGMLSSALQPLELRANLHLSSCPPPSTTIYSNWSQQPKQSRTQRRYLSSLKIKIDTILID